MEKKCNYFNDFMKLQKEVTKFKKTEDNPFFKSKYVPLPKLLEVIKPVLSENNFILIQEPFIRDNTSCLRTKLVHVSGEEIIGEIKLACKDENDPQKIGGAITYMRRYSLGSMLGIEEEDDDGNGASGKESHKKSYSSNNSNKAELPPIEKCLTWADFLKKQSKPTIYYHEIKNSKAPSEVIAECKAIMYPKNNQ